MAVIACSQKKRPLLMLLQALSSLRSEQLVSSTGLLLTGYAVMPVCKMPPEHCRTWWLDRSLIQTTLL